MKHKYFISYAFLIMKARTELKKLLHKLSNLDETDQLLEIYKRSKETTEQSNSY